MTKKEIIKAIKKQIGSKCDNKMAEFIFKKSLEKKYLIAKLNWVWVINRVIIIAIVVAAIWALLQYV